MEEQKRDFKGIWLPKDLWLDKNLTIMEKVFLAEIDSLDNEKGCFASNKYFSDFFKITKGRCSQIITSLEKKGKIKTEYKRDGKAIIERTIRVVNKLNRYLENDNLGSKYIKQGYLENDKENNTSNNNTSNIKKNIYGEFKNVLLTDEELNKLKNEFNDYKERIENLSCYIESSGKKYKSHYATILNWSRKEIKTKGGGNFEYL